MKAKVIRKFIDLKADKTREVGEIFETTKKRYKAINSTSYGILIEEIKEMEKNE